VTRPTVKLLASTVLSAFICLQTPAFAQVAPFSMDTERSGTAGPVQTAPDALPDIPYLKEPGGPETPQQPYPQQSFPTATPAEALQPPGSFRRFVLPDDEWKMQGEMATRSWSLVLTPLQAATEAKLQLTYQNAILVAPEASRLQVSINGTPVLLERISSPDRPKKLEVAVPQGLLKAGVNVFNISADQRHRTDCSIESTYELWTDIDPSQTLLHFDNAAAARLNRVAEIAAVGNDGAGRTAIQIVAPDSGARAPRDGLMRLAQNIALIADMPRQSISIVPSPEGEAALTVYFGTYDLLSSFAGVEKHLGSTQAASFMDLPERERSALLISGANWAEVERAIDAVAAVAAQVASNESTDRLSTQNRLYPDPPLIRDAARFRFSDLGLVTREFSGRQFRSELSFGLPADFYAHAYGQFTLLLDAAYAPSVLPGSHIDIYVNGEIAANIPITESGGSIMNSYPVKIPVRHARPGLNTITIEASFKTQADEVCAAGETGNQNQRFVLFDTSEVVFPKFARIGQVPDLASFASFGAPYGEGETKTSLVLGDAQTNTLSAAATLLSRLAVASGKPLPVEMVAQNAELAGYGAIFVGNIASLPIPALMQVGLGDVVKSTWAESAPSQTAPLGKLPDNQQTLEAWRKKIIDQGWRGRISSFLQNLQNSVDLSQQNLSLTPGTGKTYNPPVGANLLVAQNIALRGEGAWTIVAAPNGQDLSQNLDRLLDHWDDLSGQISALNSATGEFQTSHASLVEFQITQPLSFSNLRLIITNWVSINIVVFGLFFLVLVVLLGLAAAGVLRVFGRQS